VHALLPFMSLYVPVAHAVHTPPFGPVHPVLHEQSLGCALPIFELDSDAHSKHVVTAVAPTVVEYFPVAQSVHVSDPGAFLYVPAAHSVQEPPSDPLAPASHVQAAMLVLEAMALEFDGHAVHVVSVVAPSTPEYVSLPQSVQRASPVSVLYLPGTHIMHVSLISPYEPALQAHSVKTELPTGDVELIGHT